MTLRSLVFWLHLAAGVVAGSVVLMMSVTGVLLTYEKQMVAWAERSPLAGRALTRRPAAAARDAVAKVLEARPTATPATADRVRCERDEPVTVALGRDGQLLLNAYTGQVLGEGAVGLRAFFRSVTDWHRWLAATRRVPHHGPCRHRRLQPRVSRAGRDRGLPLAAQRRGRACSCATSPGSAAACPGKARDFNWHNTIGFWSFVAAVCRRALGDGHLLSVGEQPGLPRGRRATARHRAGPRRRYGGQARSAAAGGPQGERGRPERRAPALAGLDRHLARAERQVAGWRTISLRVPTSDRRPWSSPSTRAAAASRRNAARSRSIAPPARS